MAHDMDLNAQIDPSWIRVLLRVEMVRNNTLRQLAEAWMEDRDAAVASLDQLAAALLGPAEAWDAAALDVESDLQMDTPIVALDEVQARRLADELTTAADLTSTARRAAEPVVFPWQKDLRTDAA